MRLHRFAELDVDDPDHFYATTTEIVCAGPYDAERLRAALEQAGYSEDGDAWLRDGMELRSEVRLRDGEVCASILPAHLAR